MASRWDDDQETARRQIVNLVAPQGSRLLQVARLLHYRISCIGVTTNFWRRPGGPRSLRIRVLPEAVPVAQDACGAVAEHDQR